MRGRKWTDAEVAYLEEHAPVERAADIAEDMTRIFGREFGPEHVRQACYRRGIPHLSWKGKCSHNDSPIGKEIVYQGEVWVHVAKDKRGWKRKSLIVYEEAHGPVPSGYQVVHADRDRMNNDPGNLVAVHPATMCVINKLGIQYHDAESLLGAVLIARCRSALRRKRKELS